MNKGFLLNLRPERKKVDLYNLFLVLMVVSVLIFLLLPIFITVLVSFSRGDYIIFPPEGVSFRWYRRFLEDFDWVRVFENSLFIAISTMLISTSVGIFASLGYMKKEFKGKSLINLSIMLPFLIPGILIGISGLMFAYKIGLVGTYIIVILGHSLWGIPAVFLIMQAVLAGFDFSVEEAARDLGAGPVKTFFLVTLPLIKPGVFASLIFSFIISFGEFSIALFLTSSGTTTLPVKIWGSLKYELSPITAAVASMMIFVTLIGIVIAGKVIGVEKISKF